MNPFNQAVVNRRLLLEFPVGSDCHKRFLVDIFEVGQ